MRVQRELGQAGSHRMVELMSSEGRSRIAVGVDGPPESQSAPERAVEEARLRYGQVRAVTAWAYPTAGRQGLIMDPGIFVSAARRLQSDA